MIIVLALLLLLSAEMEDQYFPDISALFVLDPHTLM